MTPLPSRSTLEADLILYREAGDFAAQAETLLALARLAELDDADRLAQGLYGQAWAAAQQVNHHNHIIHALRGIGRVMTGTALQEEQRTNGINLDRWFQDLLMLSVEFGSRWNQAETYLTLDTWQQRSAREGWSRFNFLIWGFAIYRLSGHIPDTLSTPLKLAETLQAFTHVHQINRQQSPFHVLKDKLFSLYRERGDTVAEAYGRLTYGETAFWSKDYEIAHQELESAWQLFQSLGDNERVEEALLRLIRLAHRRQDYDLYKATHAKLVLHLVAQRKFEEAITLWLELALMASDYLEWPLVRQAYQAALMATITHAPEKQVYIYWQWGQTEFYKTHHRAMGLALCRWSLALYQRYLPDQGHGYARELRQMEREATR